MPGASSDPFWSKARAWSWAGSDAMELASQLTVRDLERLDPEDDDIARAMEGLPLLHAQPLRIMPGTQMLPGGFFVDAWGRVYRRDRRARSVLQALEYLPVRNMALGALALLTALTLGVCPVALLGVGPDLAGPIFGAAISLACITAAFYLLFARNHVRALSLAAETAPRAKAAMERFQFRRDRHLRGD